MFVGRHEKYEGVCGEFIERIRDYGVLSLTKVGL